MQSAKFVAASLIALSTLAGSAFAAEAQRPVGDVELQVGVAPSTSERTRAQVQAEYLAARAAGQLPEAGDVAEIEVPSGPGNKTRAEVRAEYFQALKTGALPQVGEHA
ncbi:DUF4148 domain-containing protein [Ramlibacter sp. 2FC]|uniref:DUF4148 domain-containing protein n=1 Tax=Ramlibacter sp. 2FC TaxID=2502188 RepID=UPI0010F65862|nr:DUF4148 domain-containing protein [Ramlibacter sp. 2FC]